MCENPAEFHNESNPRTESYTNVVLIDNDNDNNEHDT